MEAVDIIKLIAPLILLLALLYGALWLVRRYANPAGMKEKGNMDIAVIQTKTIMPKKYISVVKVKDKFLVLGISDHSISMLKELEITGDDINYLEQVKQKDTFLDLLKKNLAMK